MNKHVTATEAKNKFGELLEAVNKEPVFIQKNGRDVAVLMSKEDFSEFVEKKEVNPLVSKSMERSLKRWDKLYTSLSK